MCAPRRETSFSTTCKTGRPSAVSFASWRARRRNTAWRSGSVTCIRPPSRCCPRLRRGCGEKGFDSCGPARRFGSLLLALFLIDLAAGLVLFLPLVGRRNAGVKFYRLILIVAGALTICAAI